MHCFYNQNCIALVVSFTAPANRVSRSSIIMSLGRETSPQSHESPDGPRFEVVRTPSQEIIDDRRLFEESEDKEDRITHAHFLEDFDMNW